MDFYLSTTQAAQRLGVTESDLKRSLHGARAADYPSVLAGRLFWNRRQVRCAGEALGVAQEQLESALRDPAERPLGPESEGGA